MFDSEEKGICWYCHKKPRWKDWMFCKKCGELKERKMNGINQRAWRTDTRRNSSNKFKK